MRQVDKWPSPFASHALRFGTKSENDPSNNDPPPFLPNLGHSDLRGINRFLAPLPGHFLPAEERADIFSRTQACKTEDAFNRLRAELEAEADPWHPTDLKRRKEFAHAAFLLQTPQFWAGKHRDLLPLKTPLLTEDDKLDFERIRRFGRKWMTHLEKVQHIASRIQDENAVQDTNVLSAMVYKEPPSDRLTTVARSGLRRVERAIRQGDWFSHPSHPTLPALLKQLKFLDHRRQLEYAIVRHPKRQELIQDLKPLLDNLESETTQRLDRFEIGVKRHKEDQSQERAEQKLHEALVKRVGSVYVNLLLQEYDEYKGQKDATINN